MEPDRRSQVSDLYHLALQLPAEDRSAFLREACGGDETLRQEVESLLRFESDSARFLETPAAVVASDLAGARDRSQMIGRHPGPYSIIAPLGAGGMGEVYRARDSKLGRDVAIVLRGNRPLRERLRPPGLSAPAGPIMDMWQSIDEWSNRADHEGGMVGCRGPGNH
jgi:hypothetical protein